MSQQDFYRTFPHFQQKETMITGRYFPLLNRNKSSPPPPNKVNCRKLTNQETNKLTNGYIVNKILKQTTKTIVYKAAGECSWWTYLKKDVILARLTWRANLSWSSSSPSSWKIYHKNNILQWGKSHPWRPDTHVYHYENIYFCSPIFKSLWLGF